MGDVLVMLVFDSYGFSIPPFEMTWTWIFAGCCSKGVLLVSIANGSNSPLDIEMPTSFRVTSCSKETNKVTQSEKLTDRKNSTSDIY